MSKYIKDFEGIYRIYQTGTIYSLKSKKRIKPTKHTSGYWKVDLNKNGKRYTMLLHRLVAFSFVNNPNNYNVVNHLDENKLNTHYKNLEWVTQSENIKYYYGNKKNRKSSQYK